MPTVEEIFEELEELNWEERDLVRIQGKCPYDSPTYKSIEKDLIAIGKKEDKLKDKIYKLTSKPKPKKNRPLSQIEMIKSSLKWGTSRRGENWWILKADTVFHKFLNINRNR